MNELPEPNEPDPDNGTDPQGADPKPRPVYDTTVSESTRELRDTSRRRRDSEEKLQQHLTEAKEHVPHHYDHELHKHDQEHRTADAGAGADGKDNAGPQDAATQEKGPEGHAG
ncbi:MAG TPA: hypothetical protein DEP82_02665 [Arthrobacter bacterium]|jgi:hypothetical protein|nr:hypothetical protein [Arthrobacter sp.]